MELRLKDYKSKRGEWTPKKGKKRQKVAWRDVHLEKLATSHISKTIIGKDGAEMVLIPAGEFQMGSDYSHASSEKPGHTVHVDAFYMDRYEVTNAQYKKFVLANPQWQKGRIDLRLHDGNYLKHWSRNNYPSGKGNHPVTYVSWYAAMAYAEWIGKRLPTEAEWEKAARGGLRGQKYPWGNSLEANQANYYFNKINNTTTVGSYISNGYGLYDMVGNVYEWCLDAWIRDFYASSPRRNPIAGASTIDHIVNNFLSIKSPRVLRGGSWLSGALNIRCASRYYSTATFTSNLFGFRCVRTIIP